MDFTLIEKIDREKACYKLLKANFYRDYYVIIAQDKTDLSCASIRSTREDAISLLREIAESDTEVYTLMDILCDFNRVEK